MGWKYSRHDDPLAFCSHKGFWLTSGLLDQGVSHRADTAEVLLGGWEASRSVLLFVQHVSGGVVLVPG